MVTDAQKTAIKASWAGIDLQAAGTAFYTQLADNAPEVYAVFRLSSDPTSTTAAVQALMVMKFVDVAVKNLGDMPVVLGKLRQLGIRHQQYGARKAHFGPAGPCFLGAIAEVQGRKFTPEARDAWAAFYSIIAATLSTPLG